MKGYFSESFAKVSINDLFAFCKLSQPVCAHQQWHRTPAANGRPGTRETARRGPVQEPQSTLYPVGTPENQGATGPGAHRLRLRATGLECDGARFAKVCRGIELPDWRKQRMLLKSFSRTASR